MKQKHDTNNKSLQIESPKRSIAKTLSWRILASMATIGIVFMISNRFDIAAIVGGTEIIIKTILYYFHERVWNRIKLGKSESKSFVLWFTGLSGSGKSTIADRVYDCLKDRNMKVERLDGDIVRSIFPNTGFTKDERNSHIRRVGYLASMLEKNDIIVLASFVSPYNESRNFVRNLCTNFIEVFVSTPYSECEKRDTKGLYSKARNGEIKNFTGLDDPYEEPNNSEITIDTRNKTVEETATEVMELVNKYFGSPVI